MTMLKDINYTDLQVAIDHFTKIKIDKIYSSSLPNLNSYDYLDSYFSGKENNFESFLTNSDELLLLDNENSDEVHDFLNGQFIAEWVINNPDRQMVIITYHKKLIVKLIKSLGNSCSFSKAGITVKRSDDTRILMSNNVLIDFKSASGGANTGMGYSLIVVVNPFIINPLSSDFLAIGRFIDTVRYNFCRTQTFGTKFVIDKYTLFLLCTYCQIKS